MMAQIPQLYVVLFLIAGSCFGLSPSSIRHIKQSHWTIHGENEGGRTTKNHDHPFLLEECSDESADASSRRLFLTSILSTGLLLTSGTPSDAEEKPAPPPEKIAKMPFTQSSATTPDVDWKGILTKAGKKAIGGGRAGASAAVVQVCSLMWLRTSMNYQYRYGGTLKSSLETLWKEGGLTRLYQGLPFALFQGPLTRFGVTAANTGIVALLDALPASNELPLPVLTACGSTAAGLWRVLLMPIDSSKTASQVGGQEALKKLWSSVKEEGPAPLYRGAFAQVAATAAGHYPWFLTYNFLDGQIAPISRDDDLLLSLGRSALLGLSASCVSDCV